MPEPFDPYLYAAYLRRRWRFFALACGAAVLLALIVSLLLPKQYTATVSLVIEAGGGDPRSASVVSPVYLESLKTYETFASGDGPFQRAMESFHLRDQNPVASLESLKRRILKVEKLPETRILQISATLTDPRKAQAFANYIAEETVRLNETVNQEVRQDTIDAASKEADEEQAKREKAGAAWSEFAMRQPVDSLQEEVDVMAETKSRIHRRLLAANVEEADAAAREKSVASSANAADLEREQARRELAAAQARASLLARQDVDMQKEFDRKSVMLASRMARHDELERLRETAESAASTSEKRLQDLRGTAGVSGEQLKIIDRGAIPSRPSSPKILVNMVAALLFAAIASLVYLSIAYGAEKHASRMTPSYR